MEETRNIDKRRLDNSQMREAEKTQPPRKEGKSTFDELLDQNRRMGQNAVETRQSSKTATDQAVSMHEKMKERQRDSSKDREKEDENRRDSSGDKKSHTEVSHKVVGKGGTEGQREGSSGQGSFEGGGSAKKGKQFHVSTKKGAHSEGCLEMSTPEFIRQLKMQAPRSQNLPKSLPQEILNQIIRHIRIGLNEKGKKELELDLHQNVFKGLRLRLWANHGKVNVHFLTADGGVRELFSREKSSIQRALESKGIAVEEIKVT